MVSLIRPWRRTARGQPSMRPLQPSSAGSQCYGSAVLASLSAAVARPEERKRHAHNRDAGANKIPPVGFLAVHDPAPAVGQDDEEAAVDGVQAPEVRRRLQRRDEAVPALRKLCVSFVISSSWLRSTVPAPGWSEASS